MHVELLEYIAANTSSEYISDLRSSYSCLKKRAVLRCISRIDPEECSLREWNNAANYITGQHVHFQCRSDAKAFILEHLDQSTC